MEGFLKILLISVLVFYAFSLIIKLVFRRKLRKLQEQMEQQFGQDDLQTEVEDSKKPHIDPSIGEYTDFEEVE